MKDFTVVDRRIIVGDSYFGHEEINKYFEKHILKDENTPEEIIMTIIETVAFLLDENKEYITDDDYKLIRKFMIINGDYDSEKK